jgi:hypothetical protein
MEKKCARCGSIMNVFTVNGSSSAIADPWYCPNCVNKQDVPTYEQLRTQLAEAEERAGRMEDRTKEIIDHVQQAKSLCLLCPRNADECIEDCCDALTETAAEEEAKS